MTYKEQLVSAARGALAHNTNALQLDDADDAGTTVYHMLTSLLEFCDHENLDFDAILDEVRQDARFAA